MNHLLAADVLLLIHVLFVLFVVGGLVLVYVGGAHDWDWVRNPWFRSVHLLYVSVVVVQAWLGRICPLTDWEMAFRSRAGDAVYSGGFIAHWLQTLLYYEAPAWVFAVCYTLFAALVVYSWIRVPPRGFGARRGDTASRERK